MPLHTYFDNNEEEKSGWRGDKAALAEDPLMEAHSCL